MEHHRFGRGSVAHAEAADAYCEAILEARERVARVPGAAFPVVMRRLFEQGAWAMTDGEILALASLDGDGAGVGAGEDGEAEPSLSPRAATSLPPGAGETGADAMGEAHSTLAKFGARRDRERSCLPGDPGPALGGDHESRTGSRVARPPREGGAARRGRGRPAELTSCRAAVETVMREAHPGWMLSGRIAELAGFGAPTVKTEISKLIRRGLAEKRRLTRARPASRAGTQMMEYRWKPEHTEGTRS